MTEQGKMTDAEIVESYISDLHRKTVVSDCYTPTDGEVLEAWAAHNTPDLPTALDLVGAYDAFKRWLAEHDAKVRADEREKAARIAEEWDTGWGEIADRIRAKRREQDRG